MLMGAPVSPWYTDGENPEEFFVAADRALYRREAGRDRTDLALTR